MINKEKKLQFELLLKKFDRTFEFSDDQKAYSAGVEQLKELKRLANEMNMTSEEFEKLTGRKL